MIVYDLECENQHRFEGWFDDDKAFKRQQKKGMITCPACGSEKVQRVWSKFGVVRRKGEDGNAQINVLQQLKQFVEDNFEDVGTNFANEALKMHYGVVDHRNIRGVSTEKEEKTLKDEGVSFFKLPAARSDPEE